MDNPETVAGGDSEQPSERSLREHRDAVCDILSSRRRSTVISLLEEASEPVSFTSLTNGIVSRETNQSDENIEIEFCEDATALSCSLERYRNIVATSLYHVHLPMLADAGVIEWEPTQELIRLRDESVTAECTTLLQQTATPGTS